MGQSNDQAAEDGAPPTVPSAPSPDTRGSTGTSTEEAPAHPKAPVPADDGGALKRDGDGVGEVSPPGERVDDEAEGGKVTRRQE
jgi:hypothetical protein